jgi:hypothetical protein
MIKYNSKKFGRIKRHGQELALAGYGFLPNQVVGDRRDNDSCPIPPPDRTSFNSVGYPSWRLYLLYCFLYKDYPAFNRHMMASSAPAQAGEATEPVASPRSGLQLDQGGESGR